MVGRFELSSVRDGSDVAASSSSSLSAGLYDRAAVDTTPSIAIPGNIYPETTVSSPSPTSFAGADWGAVKPVLDNASAINYSSAAENQAAGVEPDFILGTDGQMRSNPKKTTPNADGSINVQIEGEGPQDKTAALKASNENQKASIRELIRYFTKNNPNAKIPGEWLDQLEKQPDFPTPSARREAPPQIAPQPQSQPQDYSPPPSSSSNRGFSPGGGSRPSGPGSFSPGGGQQRSSSSSDAGSFDKPARQPMFRTGRAGDVPPPIAGDMAMKGPPTITPEKIDEVLKSFDSPAAGLGQHIFDEGVKRGINPAVALAFFVQESSAGTKGVAAETNSWGNIKGEGPAGSHKGFRAYENFSQGVDDWYRLIDDKYLAPQSDGGRGYTHLSQVIHTYAPGSDNNNEKQYVANVKGMVQGWESGSTKPAANG
ncbi:MAG: glucosaminidase domain-containing protein [Candidatus Melainabacteria bacterium]|nr:glucosaminidase domain-containing protein [Candidatus Melainabacteria bacterium]